jgi:hypothetical protein
MCAGGPQRRRERARRGEVGFLQEEPMQRTLWITIALSAAAFGAQAAGGTSGHSTRGTHDTPGMSQQGSDSGTSSSRQRGGNMPASSTDNLDPRLRQALAACADRPRERRADCARDAWEQYAPDARSR